MYNNKMKKNYFYVAALAAGLSLGMVSCGDDDENNDAVVEVLDMDVLNPIVNNYADAVVMPTYKALVEKNTALYNAVNALCAAPSDELFAEAAEAWLDAREPWETSEAFLFGPVDALGLDPNMDSWPLDQAGIENILKSGNWGALEWSDDSEAEAAQGVRGFHTLEYLLWKDGQPRTVEDADYKANAASWCNYMKAVANLLKKDAEELYAAWNESYEGGDAYVNLFKNHGNSTYQTALACAEEIIDGCITIAEEVGLAKIGDPYNLYVSGEKEAALYAVESWYSWHSRDDYTNNIYSIRNAYYGTLDGTIANNSLAAFVKENNAALDALVKASIKSAEEAIQAIPQPFRNHINSTEAEEAMDACATLAATLETLKAELRSYFE